VLSQISYFFLFIVGFTAAIACKVLAECSFDILQNTFDEPGNGEDAHECAFESAPGFVVVFVLVFFFVFRKVLF
jgi:hypothetical protein